MSAIYAIISAAKAADINAAFEAMQYGPGVFAVELTDDPAPDENSPVTHYHMYNASSDPADFATYAVAKAGTSLPLDIEGNPVLWGQDGRITEAAAFAAFAELQIWANDSARPPHEFAADQRAGLGLSVKPAPL